MFCKYCGCSNNDYAGFCKCCGAQLKNANNYARANSMPRPQQKVRYYKDPGMDVGAAIKIVLFTTVFFFAGLIIAAPIVYGVNQDGSGNLAITLLISYVCSTLPLSIIRLRILRKSGNKGEIGAAGGYFLGNGTQGNGCAIAIGFLMGRWLINWIICIFALVYWFPKSMIAIIRDISNKH